MKMRPIADHSMISAMSRSLSSSATSRLRDDEASRRTLAARSTGARSARSPGRATGPVGHEAPSCAEATAQIAAATRSRKAEDILLRLV